jgi:hypothetical protein
MAATRYQLWPFFLLGSGMLLYLDERQASFQPGHLKSQNLRLDPFNFYLKPMVDSYNRRTALLYYVLLK